MRLYRVNQRLIANPLADIEGEVARRLDLLDLEIAEGARVAITAGSRGIANISAITRAVGAWLKRRGARPFIVPCMGSHNGATAEGQRAVIESLGITEDAMGMPIRASMDVIEIGEVATGRVFMDRHCHEADGVIVLNRIKLHTLFSGAVQSGLVKMMVVGMGKIRSAETFHSAPTGGHEAVLLEMGAMVVGSGKILAGLAILEDGFGQTAELHALRPDEILAREPEILARHRDYFPQLPIDDIEVLVVDAIGKTFSGTGMDTNVIGHRGIRCGEDLDRPRIRVIAALRLDPASKGNAIGVGLADVITQDLREQIDERKTFLNVYTTGEMARMKIPCSFPTDRALIEAIESRFGAERWIFIPNTLHLERIFVSEDLRDEISAHPRCQLDPDPIELAFENGRHRLTFE